MNDLELIIKYKMDDLEATAFKLVLLYEELCQKEFPNERHVKISKNKDPRKSTIFKYCYKLARETKGIFKEKDYYLYILAQLQILKLIKEGNVHALIEPQILVGEKAWKRWKIWKKKYDKKISKIKNSQELGILTSESKIKVELKSTLEFLKKNNCLSFNQFKNNIINIKRWIKVGKISPYYIVLSPIMTKLLNEIDDFEIALYRPSITPNLEKYFKEEYDHEFQA